LLQLLKQHLRAVCRPLGLIHGAQVAGADFAAVHVFEVCQPHAASVVVFQLEHLEQVVIGGTRQREAPMIEHLWVPKTCRNSPLSG